MENYPVTNIFEKIFVINILNLPSTVFRCYEIQESSFLKAGILNYFEFPIPRSHDRRKRSCVKSVNFLIILLIQNMFKKRFHFWKEIKMIFVMLRI